MTSFDSRLPTRWNEKIRVIPILVGGASIPAAENLPPEISSLLRRQVLKLDDSAFDYHVGQLVEVLEKDLGPSVQANHQDRSTDRTFGHSSGETTSRQEETKTVYVSYPPPPAKKSKKWLWIGVGAFGVFIVLGIIGSIIEEFSTPIDPQTTAAILSSIQQGIDAGTNTSLANSPASSLSEIPKTQTTENPQNPATAATDFAPSGQPAYFEPVGRWRVSLGEGVAVSLVMDVNSDGSFQVATETEGFSFPASAGRWMYDSSSRSLTLTGINNVGGLFQTLFQNLTLEEDHYHAFVPGQGDVVLRKE